MYHHVLPCIWLLLLLASACSDEEAPGSVLDDSSTGSTESPTVSPEPTEPTEASGPDLPAPDDSTGAEDSSGTTTSDATTTSAQPVCGDEVVDPGEECDLGFAANLETGACLPNCVLATCGDGYVQAGVEHCDLGAGNSLDYGGCVPVTCHWGPNCGDGVVTLGHEICDPGIPVDPMGGEVLDCDLDCRFDGRMVFLSSDTYTGAEVGGVSGADLLCQNLARAFDPETFYTYRAWLSDSVSQPADTLDPSDKPHVLLNGVLIATSFDDLLATGPSVGITITDTFEFKDDVRVWTNTDQTGHKLPDENHCKQWTSGEIDKFAMVGRNSAKDLDTWTEKRWWTKYVASTCDLDMHLYCFENPED